MRSVLALAVLALLAALGCERKSDPETQVRQAYVKARAFAEDAGAVWSLTSNDEIVFDDGWNPVEVERRDGVHGDAWRWMGRSAVLRIHRHVTARSLTLTGWVPMDLLGAPPTLTIRVGGLPVDTFIPPAGHFARTVQLPASPSAEGFTDVEVQTSSVGSGPGDPRELGYALAHLEVHEGEASR